MKKITNIILSISIFCFTSCSEDFVELLPENNQASADFYQTQGDFNSAVIATYAKLQGQVGIYFDMVEWRSDNLDLLSTTTGNLERFNINKFQETSANQIITNAWGNFYNGISRCNEVLINIPNANFDQQLINQYAAESRFIRALTYFNIVRFWGDAPIVLTPLTQTESLTVPRSPVTDIYNIIEQDLLYAVQYLPSSYPSAEFGRATSGAASTLLAKVYLTQGRYADCEITLNQVIGQYQLLSNVADVFDPENEQNQEIIFSIRFNKDLVGENHGLWFGLSDVSNGVITEKITNAYEAMDNRLPLITYQPVEGNGFAPGKFVDEESESTQRFGNDYILLRYADVLLMYAEALNAQGYQANGTAFDKLNAVRTRSGLTSYTSADLPNQDSFQQAILEERFLEFPLEGHRWFDLIRTNTAAAEILSGIGKTIQNYQLLFPVPQEEVQKINNPTIFNQNEGY